MSARDSLEPFRMTPEEALTLRRALARQPDSFSFAAQPELSALVAALGMQREVGTVNDEMARFVFDAASGNPLPRSSLRAELVRYRRAVGVRIWAEGHPRLDLRFRGIRALLHPRFSFDETGGIRACVIFPETLARIVAAEGGEMVIVRPWGMNTVFGGFDASATHYYQTNFWELENNDTLRFARLVEKRKVPFLGTHDLVAHVAGMKAEAWGDLEKEAFGVRETLEGHFSRIRVPTVASLVMPYAAGVLLDDLAQPPNYGAPGRRRMIAELLGAIDSRAVPPEQPRVLLRFPSTYEKIILRARDAAPDEMAREAKGLVRTLANEILASSASFAA